MLGIDRRAAGYTWTVVAILILVELLYRVRQTIFLFIVALLFAYLLWPLVDYLDRRLPGRSRVPALLIVYSILVAVLVILGFEIGSRVVDQANALAARIPDLLTRLQQSAAHETGSYARSLQSALLWVLLHLAQYAKNILGFLPAAGLKLLSLAEKLVLLILVPILSFFFLLEGRMIRESLINLFADPSHRELVDDLVRDLDVLLGRYMRAEVILVADAFVAYLVFLSLARVRYALLLAAVTGPLELIPMVGPFTAFVVIMVVSALNGSHFLIWIALFLAIFRLFQDYIISPRVMSAQMKLHPVLVIFGVLSGAQIAGVAGAFLSVPVMATLRVVYRRLMKRRLEVRPATPAFKS